MDSPIQDASNEINLKPPSPELEALVAETLEGIQGRTFSERNPQLGKMLKCPICGRRHRTVEILRTHGAKDGIKKATKIVGGVKCVQQFKYLHTIEDLETGEKTDIVATVPLPEQVDRGLRAQPPKKQFVKAILGAAQFKGKRKHLHLNHDKLMFVKLVRDFFVGDTDENSEGYKARITKARRLAFRDMRKNARNLRKKLNRISDASRRINRGFAPNRA
jgi:hypothetical protein